MTHPATIDEHYYCADEFHRCDGGGAGEALRYNPALLPEPRKWRTIVVDPPWAYGDKLRMGSGPKHRGADSHYVTAGLEDIARYPVGEWAEHDAHLYVWTTNAFLSESRALIDGWGFEYKTMLTWVKSYIGMGHYFRGSTEHVMFAVRGKLPLLRRDLPTHFTGHNEARRHSQKPQAFYDMVETASPSPYLDVFARKQRMGWDVAGNEVYSVIPELAAK